MSNWTKATGIPSAARKAVFERDGGRCIFCGSAHGLQAAHIVPRSRGGMGRKENLVTLCWRCHSEMDSTTKREEMQRECINYLLGFYPKWDENDMIYRRNK